MMEEEIKNLGLDIFEDIVSLRKSYVFKVKNENEIDKVNIPEGLPKFSEKSLRGYFEWFTEFENEVKKQGLSRKETCMILELVLSTNYRKDIAEFSANGDIINMLQLQILLARFLFINKEEKYELMVEIVNAKEKSNISEASNTFITDCMIYAKTCLCMREPNNLTTIDLWRKLRRHIPNSIRDRIPVDMPLNETFKDIMKNIKQMELTVKNEYAPLLCVYHLKLSNYKDMAIIMDKTYIKCYCCGEKGHLKKDCKHLKKRCDNCYKKGHLEYVCRNKVLKDNKNETQNVEKDKEYYIDFRMIKNETNPQKLRLIQKYLDQKLEHLEKQKNKDKERYQNNKSKENNKKIVRKRNITNNVCTLEELDKLVVYEEDAEQIQESQLDANKVKSDKNNSENLEFLRPLVEIKGKKVRVILGSGSDICGISAFSAKELGIEADLDISPIKVYDIFLEQEVQITKKVKIRISDKRKAKTRFAILNIEEPLILISGFVMNQLGYYIHPECHI